MSNNGNFWGREKKLKTKSEKRKAKEFFNSTWISLTNFFRSVGKNLKTFFIRISRLPKILNRRDKIALVIIGVILLGLLGYKFDRDWLSKTKKVPALGGNYTEVLVGEAKYFNPVLAKSDTDKTIDSLIYSGLTKIDATGQIAPDLAESWTISPDGKTYTFHLRSDAVWHDGVPFTSADVAATIADINDSNIQSPYFGAWQDVDLQTPDAQTVVFTLKNPYGPFLYNTLVGIIPDHLDPATISSSPVGTGPYKFSKAVSGKNSTISEVDLLVNDDYFGPKPLASKVIFQIAGDENQAKDLFGSRSTNAVAGLEIKQNNVANFSFATSRSFGLIFNLKDNRFKDVAVRKNILSGNPPAGGTSGFEFSLLTLDKPLAVAQAQSIQNQMAAFSIKVNIDKKTAIDYENLLEKRQFQAILYGFDFGYDRDPYPYFDSSQIALPGADFSGFADKNADKLLEDARMTTDPIARNQKYDQFFQIFNDQAVGVIYPSQTFQMSVKNNVYGVLALKAFEPWDHLDNFANWYLETKRIKP
ncbi:MAG: ABC transporter substrate-binding protein [Candidatus Berkelbacteria bacterium]|nr:ABC transporter substrate-binding protein [Candidatus Berkelbacteria bacterium]